MQGPSPSKVSLRKTWKDIEKDLDPKRLGPFKGSFVPKMLEGVVWTQAAQTFEILCFGIISVHLWTQTIQTL